MATEITFRPGEFQRFKAKHKFHLGALQRDLEQGEEIEFDGTNLRLDGSTHSMPKLRGVIKEGWLIPLGESVGDFVPKSSSISVRAADPLKAQAEGLPQRSVMGTVHNEERVVTASVPTASGASIGSGTGETPRAGTQYVSEAAAAGILAAQGGTAVASVGAGSGAAVGAEGEAVASEGMRVTSSSIGRLKHEQKQREEQVIINRESAKSSGDTIDVNKLAEEDPELAARLAERRAAAVASEEKVGGHPNHGAAPSAPAAPEDEIEGEINFLDVAETGSDPGDERPTLQRKEDAEKEAAQKEAAASFEWDTSIHWLKRVAKAVEMIQENPRLERRILAAETPSVAQKITAKLEELGF